MNYPRRRSLYYAVRQTRQAKRNRSENFPLTSYYIGIDVSKENLDIFIRRDKRVRTIANRAKSIERLIAELAEQHENIHLVCEASGGYEKPLLKAAFRAGRPISLINARCVRSFADAMSQHAKTDSIDAEVITHFAEVKKPSALPRPAPRKRPSKLWAADDKA